MLNSQDELSAPPRQNHGVWLHFECMSQDTGTLFLHALEPKGVFMV